MLFIFSTLHLGRKRRRKGGGTVLRKLQMDPIHDNGTSTHKYEVVVEDRG